MKTKLFAIRVPISLILLTAVLSPFPGITAAQDQTDEDTNSGWTPYQFAVWNPVQIFDEHKDVYGLRTSLFYGKNRDVYGIDISLFANKARHLYGVSILGLGNEFYHGVFPLADWHHDHTDTGDVTGLQIGGGFIGFIGILTPYPIGYYAVATTRARDLTGMQLSLLGNRARNVSGIQTAGLFNIADQHAKGLQVALIGNRVQTGSSNFQVGILGNESKGDHSGLQIGGFMNEIEGAGAGMQIGLLLNKVNDDRGGLQIGLCNVALQGMRGVQLGAVNYCRNMNGIQIGGLNIIREGKVPFFIGINAAFSF